MAYDPSNPPALISQGIGGGSRRWRYESTDNQAAVAAADYFSNAQALGMQPGDLVEVVDTDASPPVVSLHAVNTVAASGADISAGTAIS